MVSGQVLQYTMSCKMEHTAGHRQMAILIFISFGPILNLYLIPMLLEEAVLIVMIAAQVSLTEDYEARSLWKHSRNEGLLNVNI